MQKLLCGLIAVAGLAATARAQPSWTLNHDFARTPTGPAIAGDLAFVTQTGTYTFYLRVGVFNLGNPGTGQSNQGLASFSATATSSGVIGANSIGLDPATSRIAPFDFGPATTFGGTPTPAGGPPFTGISGIVGLRDLTGGARAPWLFDTIIGMAAPQPTAPSDSALGSYAPRGINSNTNVYRFTVTVPDFSFGFHNITFAGNAAPVLQWPVFGSVQPTFDDSNGNGHYDPGEPVHDGSVSYLGIAPAPVAYTPFTLQLVIPVPSSLAVLVVGGLAAMRRRQL